MCDCIMCCLHENLSKEHAAYWDKKMLGLSKPRPTVVVGPEPVAPLSKWYRRHPCETCVIEIDREVAIILASALRKGHEAGEKYREKLIESRK